jgi:Ni,Fe-hydrogenase III large subunit
MVAVGLAAFAAMALPGQSAAQAAQAPGGPALAGTPTPPPAPSRLQQVTSQIAAAQKRALQDPTIRAASQEITSLIASTASRIDPGYVGYTQRAVALKQDVAAAQAAQDNDKLWALADEAKQLQAKINAAQDAAKQDAAVKAKVDAYKVKLFQKMVELNPKVTDLVKELETLQGGASGGSL